MGSEVVPFRQSDFNPISVADALPPCFQRVFEFRYFNSIQGTCFHALYNTKHSCMVSSPTGSGKTSLFELAILGMLRDFVVHQDGAPDTFMPPRGQSKAVYVAPTRSLVQEKCKEWQVRFGSSLNLKVREFTGDSLENGKEVLQDADILCVTPERFDSVTRRNRHGGMGFFSQVKLVLLDEVHLLSDSRGPCLEAGVVSRLKMAKLNMLKENHELGQRVHFRFLACSATFENIQDVATWLGIQPDSVFKFGNEMRPVPLDIVVKGYPSSKNMFLFNRNLDSHVISILKEFAGGKPALCFCAARDDVSRLASRLSSDYSSGNGYPSPFIRDDDHARVLLDASKQIQNGTLKKCIQAGVGFHNAALSVVDRGMVEDLFIAKMLPVVATTSTLAMGVNLPAYLVIIKGVQVYRHGNGYVPLDYSTILQMIGRAGRPQFDRKGVAVIMAESKDRKALENITSLSETIESCLKGSIAEYLNAEICNRTITDIVSALEWLKTTYMYVRMLKNPQKYGIPIDIGSDVAKHDDWLTENLLLANVTLLVKGKMASTDNDGYSLQPTNSGILMAENYIKLATMSSICKAGPRSTIEDLLWILSNSEELASSIIVRRDEKNSFLNPLNQSASVKYSIKEPNSPGKRLARVKTASQKAFLLFMYALSSTCQQEFNVSFYLKQEANGLVSKAIQIVQCMIKQFSATPDMAQALWNALVLKKILTQKRWPDDPLLLTQAKDIGEVIARRLVKAGIGSLRQLLVADPRFLENTAQTHFPWGTKIKENVSKMCPPSLEIQTKIEPMDNGYLQATIRIPAEEDIASSNRGCSLLIYDLKKNALLAYRKLRYTVFSQEGMCINMPQTFEPDEKNAIIVRIVDDAVLGHDAQTSVRLVPAESKSFNSDEQRIKPARESPAPVESKLDSCAMQPKASRPIQTPPDELVLSSNKKSSKRNQSRSLAISRETPETFRKKYKNLMDFLQME